MGAQTAFITGTTGQDGSYLAQFLLHRGYRVHGLVRWDCIDNTARLQRLADKHENLKLHYGDLCDANNLTYLIKTIQPDEIYNLAALSHVKVSFETPASTLDINAKGSLNIFETVRILNLQKQVKIYQASSSEMFGNVLAPQNEETPMNPCSPYGVAKLAAYHLAKIYRDAYGLFICNGILFNHESPLRGEGFVTQKIARAVAGIEGGKNETLKLGNLDSIRDWGHARDYVTGMWMMMRRDTPDDFVLATGQAHSVREFTARALAYIGREIKWQGEGLNEKGIDVKTGKTLVEVAAEFFRPREVNYLLGNAEKARRILGWSPRISLDGLIADMINAQREHLHAGTGQWQKTG